MPADAGGWSVDDEEALFLHDVPADVVAAGRGPRARAVGPAVRRRRGRSPAWPDVPTRFLLCRDDRCFPADLQRRVVRERLGIVPDEMEGGHLPPLAHPEELARRLLAYAAERSRPDPAVLRSLAPAPPPPPPRRREREASEPVV